MTDQTFNAAEHIAAILDAADTPAVRQLAVGRWAVLIVAIDGKPYIVTVAAA
jgi:hypothetical protein